MVRCERAFTNITGRQDAFMENYLAAQRDHIFKNVAVLIYVFDIESREFQKDQLTYTSCLEALRDNSPDAKVFCLIHKMDLVQLELRDKLFSERANLLRERSLDMDVLFFPTSIWDETLYKVDLLITHSPGTELTAAGLGFDSVYPHPQPTGT